MNANKKEKVVQEEKSTAVTIRLDNKCLTALRKMAHGRQSFNSLVHQVLDKHVDFYHDLEQFESVTLPRDIFKTILNMFDRKQLIQLADYGASKVAVDFIHFKYGKVNLESVLMFIRLFFRSAGYGHLTEESKDNLIIFKIKHCLGKKGSFFLKTLVESLMASAKLPRPESSFTPDVIIFKIPPPLK